MSKANGKATTFLLLLDSAFPKTETNTMILSLETNTWKVSKCGVGEGWRRSVGPIVSKMKTYCTESKRREISYIQ